MSPAAYCQPREPSDHLIGDAFQPGMLALYESDRTFSLHGMRSAGDLTAKARIPQAGIARFPVDGLAGTTVRTIAADAGTLPTLVFHHFGSRDVLRRAYDEHVTVLMHGLRDQAEVGALFAPAAVDEAKTALGQAESEFSATGSQDSG